MTLEVSPPASRCVGSSGGYGRQHMGRLCERPGCSDPASVAYGMRAEDLVFWLDVLKPDTDLTCGGLCNRHADSMIVPRHWTLDDLREPELRLFRPPAPLPPPTSIRRRSRQSPEVISVQMTLAPEAERATDKDGSVPSAHVAGTTKAGTTEADTTEMGTIEVPWTPSFDERDDLNGLLSANSPLLARAFRGDDRPRPT